MSKLLKCLIFVLMPSCISPVIVCQYDKYKKDNYILGGDIWGNKSYRLFEEDPYIEIDTIKSSLLNKRLEKILKKAESEMLPVRFDDNYYEYAFATANGDTLYTNGYFKWWKVDGKIITISPGISSFFKKRFYNPHLRSKGGGT